MAKEPHPDDPEELSISIMADREIADFLLKNDYMKELIDSQDGDGRNWNIFCKAVDTYPIINLNIMVTFAPEFMGISGTVMGEQVDLFGGSP